MWRVVDALVSAGLLAELNQEGLVLPGRTLDNLLVCEVLAAVRGSLDQGRESLEAPEDPALVALMSKVLQAEEKALGSLRLLEVAEIPAPVATESCNINTTPPPRRNHEWYADPRGGDAGQPRRFGANFPAIQADLVRGGGGAPTAWTLPELVDPSLYIDERVSQGHYGLTDLPYWTKAVALGHGTGPVRPAPK